MKYANLRLHALLGFSAGFFGAVLGKLRQFEPVAPASYTYGAP